MGRILYLCPAVAEPRGGIRTIYHHVESLVASGREAAVVHFEAGFRPTWFASSAPVMDASGNFDLRDTDTLVFPEDFGAALAALREVPLRKVVFCQNHYHVFEILEHNAHYRDFGVERILASTNIIAAFCQRVFGLPTDVVPYALDLNRLTPAPGQRQLQIAYMPRKGPWNLRIARGILHHERPDLSGVPWVPIEGKSESETAALLQSSDVYLSTSLREGFGLPPLEAMACGAVVVGFTGGGGNEYARPDNGVWVPDEDPMALAAALARTLDQLQQNPTQLDPLRAQAVQMAQTFTLERQKRELLRYWDSFA
ncbi:MAG: glycosyltransferase [Deltaproteobacteria bacterium]|nr:glycosyltransferase [Deltaproteobacteria bacterium]